MAFEFLNEDDDSLPGATPGESQPYEMGTQDSFRKKASSFGMRQDEPQEPDDKQKYVKAKATVESAYGNAQKILSRNPAGGYVTGETRPMNANANGAEDNIDLTRERVENREHPLKIADDMRALAGQLPHAPEFQELLHKGADQMGQAYQAQSTLDEMNKPGGALAASGDEQESRYGSAQAGMGDVDQQIQQKQEQLKTTGYINAPKVQQDLQNLYNQKKKLAGTIASGGEYDAPIDKRLNMNAALTAAGWDRQDYIQANTEVRRIVGTHGINPTDPVTPSTFPIIVPKIVEEVFNKDQAAKFFAEINQPAAGGEEQHQEEAPKKPGQSKMGPNRSPEQDTLDQGLKDTNQRIAQSQARHDAVWHELAHSGNFNNVGDVIGFVLTSMVLGPRAGASLFSNMNKNGGLRNELAMIDHETTQLFHQQNSYIQLSQHARQQALNEEHQKDQIQQQDFNLQETERHHKAMEAYMGMKSANKQGWTAEEQATDKALQHGVRQKEGDLQAQEAKVKDLEKQSNNPLDPNFKKARTQLATERDSLNTMRTEHAKTMARVRKWYLDHGGKDIFPPQRQAPQANGGGISQDDE